VNSEFNNNLKKITKISQLDLNKTYSYADYLTWQLDEYVQLIKGKILRMSPSPRMNHQRVGGDIYFTFRKILSGKLCEVFVSPVDVLLSTIKNESEEKITTVVQPDICVVCDSKKVKEKNIIGAPDLIIEILSKHNRKTDEITKYNLYEENGVKEYWIVDTESRTVKVFVLKSGKYEVVDFYEDDKDEIPVNIFKGFKIKHKDIFRNVK
jgi:Uma2 family endonuclease